MTAPGFNLLKVWNPLNASGHACFRIVAITVFCLMPLFSNQGGMRYAAAQDVNNGNAKAEVQEEKFGDLRALKVLEGKWDSTIRVWTGKSGEPAIESQGSAEFKPVLGNKFIRESSSGIIGKEKYEGIGYWGFDESKKKFTRVWIDSMTTATVHCDGTIDHSRNMITYYGKMNGFSKDEPEKMIRWELDFSDSKKIVIKMFDLSIHKDAKIFEIVYTKKEQDSK